MQLIIDGGSVIAQKRSAAWRRPSESRCSTSREKPAILRVIADIMSLDGDVTGPLADSLHGLGDVGEFRTSWRKTSLSLISTARTG
jgi:hypothetical protein